MTKAELEEHARLNGLVVTGKETRDELFEAYIHMHTRRTA